MMMGLVMHAPLLFWQPDFAKVFGIENIAPAEEWINIIGRYVNTWRMPLFFLLSGFFSILIIKRKGTLQFIRDRVIRVGLTCLVFSRYMILLMAVLISPHIIYGSFTN